MLAFLRDTLLVKKFEADERIPDFVFNIHGLGKFGLVGMDSIFWMQMTLIVFLQTILNVSASLITYEYIVSKLEKKPWTSYMVGYGVVMPVMFLAPFWTVDLLDLKNKAMMLASSAGCCLLFFRCTEAMYDNVPHFAKKSRSAFVLYYASTIQFAFDPKTHQLVRCTSADIIRQVTKFGSLFLQATLLYSILFPRDYALLPIPNDNIFAGFFVQVLNNFALASLTSVCLEIGATGIGFAISLASGINTVEINESPLSKSQSPSEFWNRRWNKIVSSGLKRGVYVLLVSGGFSKPFAALSTFVASGLTHEYILILLCYHQIKETGRIEISGNHLAFFAWNAAVLILEQLPKEWKPFVWVSKTFPKPIKTLLVIMTVLPLAHLFTQEYVDNGFYTGLGMGFPRIVSLTDRIS